MKIKCETYPDSDYLIFREDDGDLTVVEANMLAHQEAAITLTPKTARKLAKALKRYAKDSD